MALPLQSKAQTDDAMSLGIRCFNICNEDPVYGSARYTGMAGANNAIGKDISSSRENPAGIGLFTQKSEILITPKLRLENEGTSLGLSSCGGVFMLGNKHKAIGYTSSALSISYHDIKDYSNKISSNDLHFYEDKGSNMWTASYGMNFANRYFYGLGINIITNKYYQKTTTEELPTTFDCASIGYNLKVGTIISLSEKMNVAAAFQTPTRFNIEESANRKENDRNGKEENKSYDDAEYHQWAPLKLSAGFGWIPNSKTTFDIDYSYQDYRAINVANSYDYYNDVKDFVENNMKSCHTIKAGIEVTPKDNINLRLGTAFRTSPTRKPSENELKGKSINYGILLPHETLFLSAGGGYSYKFLFADLAYVFKHQNNTFYSAITDRGIHSNNIKRNNSDLLLTIGAKF